MKTVKSGGPKRKNQTFTTKRHVPTERRVAAAIARNPLKATDSHRFLPGAGLPAYVAARSLLYILIKIKFFSQMVVLYSPDLKPLDYDIWGICRLRKMLQLTQKWAL
jgi:hypothetical protein